jgi:hypothetical protein
MDGPPLQRCTNLVLSISQPALPCIRPGKWQAPGDSAPFPVSGYRCRTRSLVRPDGRLRRKTPGRGSMDDIRQTGFLARLAREFCAADGRTRGKEPPAVHCANATQDIDHLRRSPHLQRTCRPRDLLEAVRIRGEPQYCYFAKDTRPDIRLASHRRLLGIAVSPVDLILPAPLILRVIAFDPQIQNSSIRCRLSGQGPRRVESAGSLRMLRLMLLRSSAHPQPGPVHPSAMPRPEMYASRYLSKLGWQGISCSRTGQGTLLLEFAQAGES